MNYQQNNQNIQSSKNAWKNIILIILGVLILGGISYGTYHWWQNSKLSQSNQLVAINIDPKDQTCQNDQDCGWVLVNCSCGVAPINKQRQEKYVSLWEKKCKNYQRPMCEIPEGTLKCVENVCKAVIQSDKNVNSSSTAGWQTYRNEEYKFEVKFLSDWGYTRFSYPEFLVGFGSPPPGDVGGGHAGKFSIQILDIPAVNVIWKQSSFEDFLQNQIMVDGVGATKTKATWPKDSINPGEQQIQVVLEHNGKTFSFLYVPTNNQDVQLFDQILSTFKFIK